MSDGIRLYIVTDDPSEAALSEIGCLLFEVPPFIRILTTQAEIAAMPNGSRCIGRWFRWSDKRPTPAQYAWIDRREAGGIEGVSGAFYSRIDEWNDKRRAAEAEILAEALAERGEFQPPADMPPPSAVVIPIHRPSQSRYT